MSKFKDEDITDVKCKLPLINPILAYFIFF